MKIHISYIGAIGILGFLLGILLASLGWWWLFFVAGLGILILCFWYQAICLCLLLGMLLGGFRYWEETFTQKKILDLLYLENQKELIGTVKIIKPPSLGKNKITYVGKNSKYKQCILSWIRIFDLLMVLYPSYELGDTLDITCQYKFIEDSAGFARYLWRHNIVGTCFVKKIKWLEADLNPPYLYKIKKQLIHQLNELFHEPIASLVKAFLLGDKSGIDSDFSNDLGKLGLSHVVVISGLHITILAGLVFQITGYFYLKNEHRIGFVILFLLFYVALIGFPASAVRGSLMGSLCFVSEVVGRKYKKGISLLSAAFIMVFLEPRLLLFDIGFQLSFFATASILYLHPIWKEHFVHFLGKYIGEIMSVTMAATIATNPMIFYYFGKMSLISPISNLLIVPIVGFLILFSLLAILTSLIFFPLGKVFGVFVWGILQYFLIVIYFLQKSPLVFLEFQINLWEFLLLLTVLCLFYYFLKKRKDALYE